MSLPREAPAKKKRSTFLLRLDALVTAPFAVVADAFTASNKVVIIYFLSEF
jgi:hypothetical protein